MYILMAQGGVSSVLWSQSISFSSCFLVWKKKIEKKKIGDQSQLYCWTDSWYLPLNSLQNDGSALLSVKSCWYPSSESRNALKPFSYNGVACLILPSSVQEQVKRGSLHHNTLTLALARHCPDYSSMLVLSPLSLSCSIQYPQEGVPLT